MSLEKIGLSLRGILWLTENHRKHGSKRALAPPLYWLYIDILTIAAHDQCCDRSSKKNHTKGNEYKTDRY
jgi:hypothetical protein